MKFTANSRHYQCQNKSFPLYLHDIRKTKKKDLSWSTVKFLKIVEFINNIWEQIKCLNCECSQCYKHEKLGMPNTSWKSFRFISHRDQLYPLKVSCNVLASSNMFIVSNKRPLPSTVCTPFCNQFWSLEKLQWDI